MTALYCKQKLQEQRADLSHYLQLIVLFFCFCFIQGCCLAYTIRMIKGLLWMRMENEIEYCSVSLGNGFDFYLNSLLEKTSELHIQVIGELHNS